MKNIIENIEKYQDWVVKVRRDLHMIPELDFELPKTVDYISKTLDELNIPYKKIVNNCAIVADITGKDENITIGLRADMDALPMLEDTNLPFSSTHVGKMHSCGHDLHMSIVLGTAKVLKENSDKLPCNVRLLFQPAEETTGGALPMIEEGAIDGVDAIFGLHVDPSIRCGGVAVKYGAMNASSYDVTVKIIGKSTHGAYPSAGIDAIVVTSQVISALQSVVSRNIDSRDSAVITFGTIHGGTKENIVAEEVTLVGTVRTLSSRTKEFTKKRITETVEFVCKGMGATGVVEFRDSYNALINHDEYVDIVGSNVCELLGEDRLKVKDLPDMGVEDFAYFVEKIPGAFFNLGVRNDEIGARAALHNNKFIADENALLVGMNLQIANIFKAYEFLTKK